jgi:hypothetical protein
MSLASPGSAARTIFFMVVAGLAACGGAVDAGQDEAAQTAFRPPVEGSCEAKAMLAVANGVSRDLLITQAGLRPHVADAVVEARPIATIADLDGVNQVGPAALAAIFEHAKKTGAVGEQCGEPATSGEIGVISDIDDTVIPESEPDLSEAPFPGVTALYQLLESRKGGRPGDVFYVTARTAERVKEIPAYFTEHGHPGGPIETGTTGNPFVARPEKVRDIRRIFERTGKQRFVFFGDTSHVDPEVQRDILAAHPDRMIAGIILKTTNINPDRVKGLHLVNDYAEAAAVLSKLETITRTEALGVMRAAKAQGLDITEAQMNGLLDR